MKSSTKIACANYRANASRTEWADLKYRARRRTVSSRLYKHFSLFALHETINRNVHQYSQPNPRHIYTTYF